MARGNWDRREMRDNDRKTSNQFAMDFLESIKRGIETDKKSNIEIELNKQKGSFSQEHFPLNKQNDIRRVGSRA